jgi:D-alanyl-lipoteichoic acid acyltransferase DltB (MBOAT superfamily)
MITFLLSGLWHGAGWTFVIWGLLHGLVSVVHQVYANYIKKKEVKWAINKKKWLYIMDIVLCYVCVNLIQIFFRADGVQQAFKIYSLLFTYHEGIFQPYTWTFFAYIILIVATIIAYKKSINIGKTKIIAYYPIQDLSTIKGLTIFFVICGLAIIMGYFGETYFIYGQF